MQTNFKKFPVITSHALYEPAEICQVIADKKVSYRDLVIFHLLLWGIAVISRISYNIIGYFFKNIQGNDPSFTMFKGVLPVIMFYAGVFIIFYQLELLHLVFHRNIAKKTGLSLLNRKNVFVAALLPFSTTAIFWIFPFPVNILLTLVGLGISGHAVYRLLIRECRHNPHSVADFALLAVMYFSMLGMTAALVYNIYRMIFL